MEKTFKNTEKEYIAPEMEEIMMKLESGILDGSGDDWEINPEL